MTRLLFLFCWINICLVCPLWAQLTDDFSDGDFSSNPAWTGETNLFQISPDAFLQSNGIADDDTIHLITANSRLSETEWRFYVRYNFAPSTSNRMRIYLVSDQSDLEGDLNGYFVSIGESGSNDSYDLFRQDGASLTKIIDGVDGRAGSEIDALVRVLRDDQGNWSLFTDVGQSGQFLPEGSVMDVTYASTNHFGLWVRHSSTRNMAFFFDDFYIGDEIVDSLAPELVDAMALSDTEVEVQFSETLDSLSASNPANYQINGGIGPPSMAVPDQNDASRVLLTLANNLVNASNYSLTVENVTDLAGNPMNSQTIQFQYLVAEPAQYRDIIFNELMADPVPVLNLPNAEYIELFNRSNKVINLEGWTISNGSTVGTLPAAFMLPNDHLILAKTADAPLFTSFGDVLSPSSWPALVNGGDNLGIRSANDVLIDSLDYQLAWYNDPVKQDGGYSLELINPDNETCPPRANWAATIDTDGGTPGIVNSIFSLSVETTPPVVLSTRVTGPQQVQLCFSEPMDESLLNNPLNYMLDQGFGNPINAVAVAPDFICVDLNFDQALEIGKLYQLTVSDVSDCSGNQLAGTVSIEVVQGISPQAFELVITEIMADPEPRVGLPDAEYVEIYNRSDKVLDLQFYQLHDGGAPAVFGPDILFPGEYRIVCARLDSADFAPFGKLLLVDNMPSINNGGDSLYLANSFGQSIDYVFFDLSWYGDAGKSEGGWSLERIDPQFVDCNQPGNWRASESETGGSPGQENSVFGTFVDDENPFVQQFSILGSNQISLLFSEQMNADQLEMVELYQISGGIGQPILAQGTFPHYRSVALLLDADLQPGQLYHLIIEGLEDCAGNPYQDSISFGLPELPETGDVLLNEILFNPFTGGADFVEIFNASNKVLDLNEMWIGEVDQGSDSIFNADRISENSYLFLPGELLCLTRDVAFQQMQYLPPMDARFLQMSDFPSYDDDDGECIVYSSTGPIMDRFRYFDDFHYPTLADDEGVSLERISLSEPGANPFNWHSAAAIVNYATPGYVNSQAYQGTRTENFVSLEPQTFSPNGDGENDVLAIHYEFPFPGANARVSILDSQGRLIRQLQPNTLLSPEAGTFFWDGRDAKNTKADIGMYIVLFEVTNQQTGSFEVYRQVCVLADRL